MSKEKPSGQPAPVSVTPPRYEKLSLPPTGGMTNPPRPPKPATPTTSGKK